MRTQHAYAAALGAYQPETDEMAGARLYRVEVRVADADWVPVASLPVYTSREAAEAAQETETGRVRDLRTVLADDRTKITYRVTSIPYVWAQADVEGPETDFQREWGTTIAEVTTLLDGCGHPAERVAVYIERGLPVLNVILPDGARRNLDYAAAAAAALTPRYDARVLTINGRDHHIYEVKVNGPYPLNPRG